MKVIRCYKSGEIGEADNPQLIIFNSMFQPLLSLPQRIQNHRSSIKSNDKKRNSKIMIQILF